MKQIPLSQGLFALVDDEDYESVSKFKWYAKIDGVRKYAARNIKLSTGKRTVLKMHRQILKIDNPSDCCDHINGNGLDNRRENLRVCTIQQNLSNRGIASNNRSGFKGVYWSKRYQKWEVEVWASKKKNYVGRFISLKDAAIAYNEAAKKHHGEFARLNIVI